MDVQEALNSVSGLIYQLTKMVERDPDQEVTGIAVPVLDAALSAARSAIPNDPVVAAMPDLISAEAARISGALRAADVLLVAETLRGALLRALPPQQPNVPAWLR